MDPKISGHNDLQRRCISVIIEQLIRVGRSESIKYLELPCAIVHQIEQIHRVQQTEGIRQWKEDSVLLWPPRSASRPTSTFTDPTSADIPNTPPFSDHFRWMNENGSIKIDRRTTAAAQLDNLDLTAALPSSIQFGFILATTYCLENHIRRFLPYWKSYGISLEATNPMTSYWIVALDNMQKRSPQSCLLSIRPQSRGSSDFWLAVIRSFWPIAAQIGGTTLQTWVRNNLESAMNCGHKCCVDFVWSKLTENMRKSLVSGEDKNSDTNFLKAAVRANEKEILIDSLNRFDNADARRASVSRIIPKVCGHFNNGHNLEIFEHLLERLIADDCTSRISLKTVGPLCKILSTIWDSLTPQKRARLSNDLVDLLHSALDLGYLELATRIWSEEKHELHKFEMLFRDECAAFRSSCANGHLVMVRAFWEWASTEQRCRMITCKFGDALRLAARNGHLSVMRYLWENMESRVACETIDSRGIDEFSLSQLIAAESNNKSAAASTHELENFLFVLIRTPLYGNEPIYTPSAMKEIAAGALLLDNGKALKVLVQRAKDNGGDPTSLRTFLATFDDDQRVRLCSKLTTTNDIELCGLESAHLVTRLLAMAVQPVRDQHAGEDGEDEEEYDGEVIDLIGELDEYSEG